MCRTKKSKKPSGKDDFKHIALAQNTNSTNLGVDSMANEDFRERDSHRSKPSYMTHLTSVDSGVIRGSAKMIT